MQRGGPAAKPLATLLPFGHKASHSRPVGPAANTQPLPRGNSRLGKGGSKAEKAPAAPQTDQGLLSTDC